MVTSSHLPDGGPPDACASWKGTSGARLMTHPVTTHVDHQQPRTGVVARPRITGIDLARGLAMFGMLAAHVGPASDDGTPIGALMGAAHGRSSILFATLAGISLALMSGGPTPPPKAGMRKARGRIATRAIIILTLGTVIVTLGTPVSVILAYYGLFFLLALPFLRLRPRSLLILAGSITVIGPVVSLLLQSSEPVNTALDRIDQVDPIALLSGEGFTELLLTGAYPALTWMPFLFVGLALGRTGVARLRKLPVALTGLALMVIGYLGSLLALRIVPNADAAYNDSMFDPRNLGVVPLDWTWLLGADEHTGTPFEIVGGIGTALVVIAATLWLAARFPRATWPIAAVGTMSLTVYTGHVVAINLLGLSALPGEPLWILVAFITAAIAFATIWLRFFRRGPLETLMHTAATRTSSTR